jgi:DNA ligase-4
MPFLFSHVCDLLQRLEDNLRARSGVKSDAEIIRAWFREHTAALLYRDHNSAALLSTLLLEKRTDRVYFLREKKLQTIIGRALGLGRSRIAELSRWQTPGACVDLAECVESILKQTVSSPNFHPRTRTQADTRIHNQTPYRLLIGL